VGVRFINGMISKLMNPCSWALSHPRTSVHSFWVVVVVVVVVGGGGGGCSLIQQNDLELMLSSLFLIILTTIKSTATLSSNIGAFL
jgi:hypothetical protein